MSALAPPVSGLIVDLAGFITGIVLYVMLVAMVWRERAGERASLFSRQGRLPLLTGLFGLIWNVGALASFGIQAAGSAVPLVVAIAFGALGFLPAAVVHSLIEGREVAVERRARPPGILAAYALSGVAASLHILSAVRGAPVPSRAALWLLTIGFTLLTGTLLVMTRRQPIGRRGIWVSALSIFAVTALHFGRHAGNESWWVELIGHHASLPLALAILHQDYRFALADLFLKHAIALMLLVGVSLGVFSTLGLPLLGWQDAAGDWDPRAMTLFMVLWIGTALTYPWLRHLAARLVDRAVLRRPDYAEALAAFGNDLETVETEAAAIERALEVIRTALASADVRAIDGDQTPAGATAVVPLRTVDAPHPTIAIGALSAGRRLLSDDLHWLEAMGRLTARRIDAIRVAEERLTRNLREQEMERLATEAELRALRAQLQPHFLFNALTTIGHLIQQAPPRALDTLLRLTSVLRGVLRRSTSEFSTLGDEIDLITSYLDIEQARFEERLRVVIDVPPDARQLAIPTLLLQPIVENAIRHGIGQRAQGGFVAIRASATADRLRVTIEDSGRGFAGPSAIRGRGLGLTSVQDRLRVHYGALGHLDIQSAEGAGTAVSVEFPATKGAPRAIAERRAG